MRLVWDTGSSPSLTPVGTSRSKVRCSLAGSSKRFAHDCFAPMLKQNVRSLNSTASARSLAQLTLPACSVAARLKRRLCRSLQEEGALPADKNEKMTFVRAYVRWTCSPGIEQLASCWQRDGHVAWL